jgi:hypothetical protein
MQIWFESEETAGVPGVMKVEKDNLMEFRAFYPKHYYYIQKVGDKYKYQRHSRVFHLMLDIVKA